MTSCKILCLSLSLALSAALGTQSAYGLGAKKTAQTENMEIRDKWALTIGINRFADPAIAPQKLAQKSSADVARALKDPDSGHFALDHVFVLNGSNASKAGIEQVFNQWLYKKALPDHLVIIYINSRVVKNKQGKPILLASDSQLAQAETSGIDLLELLKTARQRIGSSHILCLLDLSAGSKADAQSATNPDSSAEKKAQEAAAKNSSSEQGIKWLASSSGVTVLSASDLYQNSNDDNSSLQSYFVHYFVEALKTGGGNYPLAMTAEYVWQKVKEATSSSAGGAQSPVLGPAAEQDETLAVPIGIMVGSSVPKKQIAIGHSLDNLALDRPDIIAPSTAGNRQAVKIVPKGAAQAGSKAVASASNPAKASPVKAAAAKAQAAASDSDDEDDFDPNLDMRPYMSKMKLDIQKNWKTPKGFESRKVGTMFSILRDGKIANIEITESSGNDEMDKSAMDALNAASPLDPLPKGAPRSIDIKYVFDWKTSMQTKR